MDDIASKIEKIIIKTNNNVADIEAHDYEDAIREFKEMIDSGLARPRGNNLCLIQDSCNTDRIEYNTSSHINQKY